MELRKIVIIIRKYLVFITALAFVGLVTGYQAKNYFPSGYRQSQLFFLTSPQNNNASQNLDSSAYFNQENARNFTDTAVALLASGDFSKNVFENDVSVNVRKLAPQILRITLESTSTKNLDQGLNKIELSFNSQIEKLAESTESPQLKPAATPSPINYFAPNKLVLAAAGFILGFAAAGFTLGLKFYFRV